MNRIPRNIIGISVMEIAGNCWRNIYREFAIRGPPEAPSCRPERPTNIALIMNLTASSWSLGRRG